VGKQTRPEREEQEFLFRLFLSGCSDKDILDKYTELQENAKLVFPLRSDPRTIRRIRVEFEAARAVLEPYLRQQLDPAFEKARQEHLDRVRASIESWNKRIFVPPIDRIQPANYGGIPHPFAEERNSSWFEVLKAHLPRPGYGSLWDAYEHWQNMYVEYLHLHEDLHQQILKEAKTRFNIAAQKTKLNRLREAERNAPDSSEKIWLFLPAKYLVMPHVDESFTAPFFQAFEASRLGAEVAFDFRWPEHYSDAGMVLEELHVNNTEVLVSEAVSGSNQSEYEAMVKEYLNNKKVTELIASFDRLRGLTNEISLSIGEILERRDYLYHTCRLCPGSVRA